MARYTFINYNGSLTSPTLKMSWFYASTINPIKIITNVFVLLGVFFVITIFFIISLLVFLVLAFNSILVILKLKRKIIYDN